MIFYIPQDTTALALGSEAVARALQTAGIEPVRNGSRGMFWLEPLLEVETDQGRIAFGPVSAKDIPGIIDAVESDPTSHALYLGAVAEIPYLKSQQRLTYARAGLGDPVCLNNYQTLKGFKGLKAALQMTGQQIVDQVKDSGLRGRGGAAFPAGIKWQTVLNCDADQKYIVCNADEGDSGTFADRLVMEADPYQLIEGMIIPGRPQIIKHRHRESRCGQFSRRKYPRLRQNLSPRSAPRCRSLYLRRRNLITREPRGQAWNGSRQTTAPSNRRFVWQAYGGQ